MTDPVLVVRPDSKWMVRALGLLYVLGSTIALVSQLLPRSPNTDTTGVWVLIAIAYGVAPILVARYERLPLWAVSLLIALANTLVSGVVYFNHEATSPFAWFYLYVTPYAAAFFSRPHAAAHVGYVAVSYAVLLLVHAGDGHRAPGDAEVIGFVHVMGALGVTFLLVGALTRALRENAVRVDEERRRRAVEINDDIVQRLVLARQAYADDDRADGDAEVDAALEKARRIMAEMIGGDEVRPGSLRRESPSTERA